MSKLVEELKKDHNAIADILEQVSKMGISTKEGQQRLLDAKQGLLAHLKKEDEQLYPVLNKAAGSDATLKKTLDMFAGDTAEISKAAMAFFNKYAGGGSGIEFAKEIGKLFTTLKSRISKEENILYKEYDRLNP